jgi:ABC-type transport system involved in cytochrome c biogenesis permease component
MEFLFLLDVRGGEGLFIGLRDDGGLVVLIGLPEDDADLVIGKVLALEDLDLLVGVTLGPAVAVALSIQARWASVMRLRLLPKDFGSFSNCCRASMSITRPLCESGLSLRSSQM